MIKTFENNEVVVFSGDILTLKTLQKIICSYFKIDFRQLKCKTRKRGIVEIRQIYLSVAYYYCNYTILNIEHSVNLRHGSYYRALELTNNEYVLKPIFDKFIKDTQINKLIVIGRSNKKK